MTSGRDKERAETAGTRDIFTCTMCGDCCKGYGGTVVTEKDIRNIAEHIGVDPRRFVEEFCQMSGGKAVLGQAKNGYCLFWDDLCTIHPVKPRMCRAWPFIPAVLVDAANWRAMAASCPGMRADVPDAVITARVRKKLGQ